MVWALLPHLKWFYLYKFSPGFDSIPKSPKEAHVIWSENKFKLKAWSTAMAQPVETTTILNAEPFWMLLEINTLLCQNAPWDEHSMMFFKSVADLCFTGPFLYLAKPSTNIDHSVSVDKRFRCESVDGQTASRSIKTTIWCQNIIFHRLTFNFDLRRWPTIPT